MAQSVTLNGTTYSVPDAGDEAWGSTLTTYLVAVAPRVETAITNAATAQTTANSASTAAATAQSEVDALEVVVGTPASAATPSTIVKRDASGNATFATVLASTVETTNLSATGAATVATLRPANIQLAMGDESGAPGNATVNALAGKAAIANGANTVTITNNKVAAESLVIAWMMTAGSGARIDAVVPAAGSFTVTTDTTVSGAATIGFLVINPE